MTGGNATLSRAPPSIHTLLQEMTHSKNKMLHILVRVFMQGPEHLDKKNNAYSVPISLPVVPTHPV